MSERGKRLLAPALLLALTAAIYARTIRFGFCIDDGDLIGARAIELSRLGNLPRFFVEPQWPASAVEKYAVATPYYRPLVTTLNALCYRLGGGAPWAFHAASVGLQAANVLLVRAALLALGGSAGASLAGAALFASHPLVTANAAWVSGRTDLLCATLLLGSLLAWLRRRRGGGPIALAGALALLFGALLAKEAAAVFPAVLAWHALLAVDGRGRRRFRALVEPALSLLPLGAWLALRARALPPHALPRGPAIERLGEPLAVLGYDLAKMLAPVRAPFLPNESELTATAWLLVGALGLLALAAAAWRARSLPARLGVVWLLAFLAPVLQLVPVGVPGARYYFYLPLAGAAMIALPAIERLARQPRRAAIVVGALVAAGAVASYRHAARFASQASLFETELAEFPDDVKALHGYGKVLFDAGRFREANALLARARAAAPDDAVVLRDYAISCDQLGEDDLAIWSYRLALDKAPTATAAWVNWGNILLRQRRWDEALPLFERAKALSPGDPMPRGGAIAAENGLRRYDRALAEYEEAAGRGAVNASVASLHGTTLLELGRYAEAAASYEEAIVRDASYVDAYRVAGLIYARYLRDPARARARLGEFLRRARPDAPERPLVERELRALP